MYGNRKILFYCKICFRAAFRSLCIMRKHWRFLLMKAKSPFDGKWYWFADKCLPFGSSISCSLFQKFSDCVAHIYSFWSRRKAINYLDDFLFAALLKALCDKQVDLFLQICSIINFPISEEKTFRGTQLLSFLGFLIDTVNQIVLVPSEKITRALNMINFVLSKIKQKGSKRKITVLQLQKICGFLNFLGRAIIPGRAFTRRLYAKLKNVNLKPHHHIRINKEMQLDLEIWEQFVKDQTVYCRPFMDFSKLYGAEKIQFYTDASKNYQLGFGGFCQKSWMFQRWGKQILRIDPSIGYLELYAVVAGLLLWVHRFENKKIVVFCDNLGAVHMINSNSSNCKNCMVLIRIMVLQCLKHNCRVYAEHVSTEKNEIADSLSRLQFKRFKKLTRKLNFEREPTPIPECIWPLNKIWM